jgi:hypothetical protein
LTCSVLLLTTTSDAAHDCIPTNQIENQELNDGAALLAHKTLQSSKTISVQHITMQNRTLFLFLVVAASLAIGYSAETVTSKC